MKGRKGGRTHGRTVDDVMAIKSKFLASMGYQYFLSSMVLRARSSTRIFIQPALHFTLFSFGVFVAKLKPKEALAWKSWKLSKMYRKISLLPQKRRSGDKLLIPQSKQNMSVVLHEIIYYPNIFVSKHVERYFSGTVSAYIDSDIFPLI